MRHGLGGVHCARVPGLGGVTWRWVVGVWRAAWVALVAGGRRMCRGVRAVTAGSGRFLPGVLPAVVRPGRRPGRSWVAAVFGAREVVAGRLVTRLVTVRGERR